MAAEKRANKVPGLRESSSRDDDDLGGSPALPSARRATTGRRKQKYARPLRPLAVTCCGFDLCQKYIWYLAFGQHCPPVFYSAWGDVMRSRVPIAAIMARTAFAGCRCGPACSLTAVCGPPRAPRLHTPESHPRMDFRISPKSFAPPPPPRWPWTSRSPTDAASRGTAPTRPHGPRRSAGCGRCSGLTRRATASSRRS